MAISKNDMLQNHYVDAMRHVQNTYGQSDPALNAYMQQQLMAQARYSHATLMPYMHEDEQFRYVSQQMQRMADEYNYVYKHAEGPTQQELDRNPSLRDAWEQYLIIKGLSK